MDIGKGVEALDRFFLDIIGTIVPGLLLVLGVYTVLGLPISLANHPIYPPNNFADWVVLIVIGYIVGFAVASIGEHIVLRLFELIVAFVRRRPRLSTLVPEAIQPRSQLIDDIRSNSAYKALTGQITKTYPWLQTSTDDVRAWRGLALSIAPELSSLTQRFMFISLLNLGIATSLLCIAVVWLALGLLRNFGFVAIGPPLNVWLVLLLVLGSIPFLERQYIFYGRAMRLPFTMDPSKVSGTNSTETKLTSDAPISSAPTLDSQKYPTHRLSVYLAGGFRSGWQDTLVSTVEQFRFIDPRIHKLDNIRQYTLWDLEAIRRCDYVFAYLEVTNPAGFALALEIGFAKALGKQIILVDEKSVSDVQMKRHLGMVQACADVLFDTLPEAIEYMKQLERIPGTALPGGQHR